MADPVSADEGEFRIDSRVEIAHILQALMKSNASVTAYFNGGKAFIVTGLLELDPRGFITLDSVSKPELNQRLLHSRDVSIVGSHDGVRVQFAAQRVEAVSFEGRLAFRIPTPEMLIKLQRREHQRIATPTLQPLSCELRAADGRQAELPLADISLGGVCLVGEPATFGLEPGMVLKACRIALPEVGTIQAGLCVRNSYTVTLKDGAISRRTGCAFVELGAAQEAMVQRHIMRVERERRSKRIEAWA